MMNRQFSFFMVTVLFLAGGCRQSEIKNHHIPSLDEIAAQWVSADTMAMEPSFRNFRIEIANTSKDIQVELDAIGFISKI